MGRYVSQSNSDASRLKNSPDYGKKFGIATAEGCPCVAGKHSRVLVLVFIQVVTSQK